MSSMLEKMHFGNALPPVADALAGTIGSDIFNMKNFGRAIFVLQKGVGTTGTSTITVEACDDVSASNSTAVPFRYRNIVTGDTQAALTEVDSDGFATTAGSNHLVVVEVDAVELAKTGYGYVRLAAVEVANDPVLAGILFIGVEPRYSVNTSDTWIT